MAAGLTQTTHTPSIDTILERLLDDMEAPPDAYASEPPVWAKDPFNGGYAESCGRCGSWCEVVRPGKTQCPHCWDDPDRAVRINAAAAISDMAAKMVLLADTLRPFSRAASDLDRDAADGDLLPSGFGLTFGDLRRAWNVCNGNDGAADDRP